MPFSFQVQLFASLNFKNAALAQNLPTIFLSFIYVKVYSVLLNAKINV